MPTPWLTWVRALSTAWQCPRRARLSRSALAQVAMDLLLVGTGFRVATLLDVDRLNYQQCIQVSHCVAQVRPRPPSLIQPVLA